MINFEHIIQAVFEEENIASDVLGEPAGGTSQFSADKLYAQGDPRVPYIAPGVVTRKGVIKRKRKKRKKK